MEPKVMIPMTHFSTEELDLIVGMCDVDDHVLELLDKMAPQLGVDEQRIRVRQIRLKCVRMLDFIQQKQALIQRKNEGVEAPAPVVTPDIPLTREPSQS